MASRISGITIEIGADTTKLQTQLKSVDKQLSSTQTSLRDVNKLLKVDPGNVQLLTQKQQLLTNAIKDTKDRLKQLKEAQSQFGEGTDEWNKIQREIVDTENKLENLEGEMKSFGSVGAQQLAAVGNKLKALGTKITAVGKKMTTYITLPLVAAGTASVSLASDYEENLNKIDVAFGKSADKVKQWAKTANTQFGMSVVSATDAASSFGALAKGIGLAEDTAADMSIQLAGLTADLGSYFNAGTDESATALEGIFTGEAEALKKFGIVMNDTNLKQFAEDQGLVWSELDQTQKTLVRYKYVLEHTQDAQGDFADTSDGMANGTKQLKAEVENLSVAFGEKLLPMVTPVVTKVTELINKFSELDTETQDMIFTTALVVAAVGPVVVAVGSLITAVGSILTLVPALQTGLTLLTTTALGPIAVTIAAVVAVGVVLYQNWDKIKANALELKNRVVEAWNGIKNTVSTNAALIKSYLQPLIDKFNAVKKAVVETFDKIKTKVENIVEKLKNAFDFKWELPKIKLPHFSVSGKFSLNPLSVPKFEIEWYKKAYNNPYLFTSPTVIGNKGFGDGGGSGEIVYGRDQLMKDIAQASGGITVNVYGNANMSVNELADAVQNRLARIQRQRARAYAT